MASDAVVLVCGDTPWPGAQAGTVVPVPARPGRAELGELLAGLADRRLVVCGTDADLAAVLLRLLRTEALGVAVGYVPAAPASAVARLWGLPVAPVAAAEVALRGEPDRVPLVRDDAGGVLVGLGVVAPVHGVAYCDDDLVFRGQARRMEVRPDQQHGLAVRVVRGPLGRVRRGAGRAVQLGCSPTDVCCDGVPGRTTDRWTWYRHTEDWRLVH
ncbi:MAG: hypothetical protein ACRDSP_01960 [Pseudonocardiaceae bacterium]